MSMFSYLKCEMALPDSDNPNEYKVLKNTFQTKNLERELGNFKISRTGKLLKEIMIYDYEQGIDVGTDNWVFYPYTGELYFYDFIKNDRNLTTYRADVNNGEINLTTIRLV